jgi:hypothetical protein
MRVDFTNCGSLDFARRSWFSRSFFEAMEFLLQAWQTTDLGNNFCGDFSEA